MLDTGIIILNYEKYELTKACVDTLLSMKVPAKIVIVDNASSNNSYEKLSKYYKNVSDIDILSNEKNSGYAAGNNTGAFYLLNKYPEIKYLCIMNPDVEIIYPEIFDNLKAKLKKHDNIAAITGLMLTNGILSATGCFWNIPKGFEVAYGHSVLWKNKPMPIQCDKTGTAEAEVIPGAFFMIKADAFKKLEGFDEGTFLYNEENILALKIKDIGMTNALSINDYYFHNHMKGKRKKLYRKLSERKIGNQSRRYLCKKYYGNKEKALLEMVIFSNYVVIILKHICGNVLKVIKK